MRNLFLAIASGLLLSFGWPTWGFPLLLFFGFVPLLFLERNIRLSDKKRKGWRVFLYAYLTFFIWNLIKTNWLWFSTEFGAAFAILVNSLIMALVFVLYYHFSKKATFFISLVFLICLWISFEKMHLNWDFSWPWLNLGNGFSEYISWIQWYEFTGTFGGTLWIWLANFLLFKAIISYKENVEKKSFYKEIGIASMVIIIPILISLIQFYTYQEDNQNPVEIVVLQPNIDPYSKKYDMSNEQIAGHLFSLAEKEDLSSVDFVISPETVFAQNERIEYLDYSNFVQQIRNFNKTHPSVNFLTGVSLYAVFEDESKATHQTNTAETGVFFNTYNSALMLSAEQPDLDIYHKSKLVVGVESTPYVWIIKPLLGDIMLDLGGTVAMKTTQENREVFFTHDKKYAAAPIICYESVYGEFVTGYVRNGANFLAIITNDAWWDETQGHKQHLSLARLRAIETRRSIARSANTGISTFINQKGEMQETLAYNTEGALKATINTNDQITFYVKYGDIIYRIALFVLIAVILIRFTRRRSEVGV